MYGPAEYQVWRQRPEEIRHEVAVARLEKMARANQEIESGLLRGMKWELARYAGLLGKLLTNNN